MNLERQRKIDIRNEQRAPGETTHQRLSQSMVLEIKRSRMGNYPAGWSHIIRYEPDSTPQEHYPETEPE